MRKVLTSALICFLAATAAGTASAQDRPIDYSSKGARVFSAPGAQSLTLPSQAAPGPVVSAFLHSQGHLPETVSSLIVTSEGRVSRTGLTHLRFAQEVEGLTVYGTYVKAAVNDDGELIHLIENLVTPPPAGLLPTVIGERAALDAALDEVHPGVFVILTQGPRDGNTMHFSGDDFFYRDPAVTRVAIPMQSGVLQEGYLVETWTDEGNLLHHTLVGGTGRVLKVELRTNNDSYNIFPDHPDLGGQIVVDGPDTGNAESPLGWLSGSQTTVNIGGNNANAYLDVNADNLPDPGGISVTDGNFLTSADLEQQPDTMLNKEVAVQNLFYFNNVIHDKLYSHGFNEAAGNFQEDNNGVLGGLGGDPVNAEAQDGSGLNNANFATPSDGFSPRMQMFLWSGKGDYFGDYLVEITGGPTYFAMGANFGPSLDATGLTGDVVVVDDGTGVSTSDGCEAIINDVSGKIALIDRGDCTFVLKVTNAQNAGAVGAIIANNLGDDILTMGGIDSTIAIPSVFIGQGDGAAIRTVPVSATLKASPAPLKRDGDVDSDIIWHEYGHGLTWRMIGGMSGDMSGAIGEGMSDVLAILANNQDTVAEYSTNSSNGIRTAPYTNYGRTYGNMTGSSVHFDGEIYAATIWHLWELFQANSLSVDTLYGYLVGGMNFTPAGPAMEDMRDGILQAADGSGDECLIWDAFADFGTGAGATSVVNGGNLVSVTETFGLPVECGGDPNTPPTVSITSPADGLVVTAGDSVNFAGAASDGEQGDLTASLAWTSDLDNAIGSGGSFSTTGLSAGVHTITASVTDIGGLTGSATVKVTVNALVGGEEVVTITKANYNSKKDKLDVDATSSAAPGATLTLHVLYGIDEIPTVEMIFDPNKAKYTASITALSEEPTSVMVTSSEGGEATVGIGGGGGGGCNGNGKKPGCP